MIEVKNVSRRFKVGDEYVTALDKVSLTIHDGEFVAFMGPSGSGKTTLLNLIGGLDQPDNGEISVDDKRIDRLNDKAMSRYRNKELGFVFQSFNLQTTYTAVENVALPLFFARLGSRERKKRARKQLDRVGLANRAEHRPHQLSAGQRQRVAIARALVNEPRIILADEPTGNLDTKNGKDIVNLLRTLSTRDGVTVIMVTHDEMMAKAADRIVRIRDGKFQR